MGIQVQRTTEEQMEILMGLMVDLQKQQFELRKSIASLGIRELVEKEVEKSLGDKYHMIVSTLNDVTVQRRIFIEKGFITRDEINKKYEELKAGK